jgi:eukaryotic-like serine/threonine-protein kinase
VNISYNMSQIVGQLSTEQQQALFGRLVLGYNAVVYPIAIMLFVLAVRPVARCWNALTRGERISAEDVAAARMHALHLPGRTALLTALGWFPGGVLFPWMMGIGIGMWGHFVVSFFLSGLIAMAYSLCGAQYVVLRVLYPGMWLDTRRFGEIAAKELAPMPTWLALTDWLARSIPILAGVLLLVLGGEADFGLRSLVTGLLLFGVFGSQLTSAVTRTLSRVIAILTGGQV